MNKKETLDFMTKMCGIKEGGCDPDFKKFPNELCYKSGEFYVVLGLNENGHYSVADWHYSALFNPETGKPLFDFDTKKQRELLFSALNVGMIQGDYVYLEYVFTKLRSYATVVKKIKTSNYKLKFEPQELTESEIHKIYSDWASFSRNRLSRN